MNEQEWAVASYCS